mmetsp:Transcript_14705/g.47895  ORF Transcript_14705/g.47895 Transcript_14705/m.47895 type:complete len:255 (-) Transcript_14705:118-882(-)
MEVDRARSPENTSLLPLSAGPLSLTSARPPLPAMRWSVRMAPFALATHNAGSTQAGVLDKTPPPSPPPTVCSSCSHHVVAQLGHLRQTRRRARRPRNRLRAGRPAALLLVSDRRGQRGRRREDRPRWDTHLFTQQPWCVKRRRSHPHPASVGRWKISRAAAASAAAARRPCPRLESLLASGWGCRVASSRESSRRRRRAGRQRRASWCETSRPPARTARRRGRRRVLCPALRAASRSPSRACAAPPIITPPSLL